MTLDQISDIVEIVALPLTLFGLAIGYFQFRSELRSAERAVRDATNAAERARSVALAEQVMAVDDALRPYEEVRALLNRRGKKPDYVQLRRYIAVFERLGLVLELDLITIERVNELYGSRIRRLVKHERARDILSNASGWRSFNYQGNARGLPAPPKIGHRRRSR